MGFGAVIFVVEAVNADGRSAIIWPQAAAQILATLLIAVGLTAKAFAELRTRTDLILASMIGSLTLWAFNSCIYVAIRGDGLGEVARPFVASAIVALMVLVVGLAVGASATAAMAPGARRNPQRDGPSS